MSQSGSQNVPSDLLSSEENEEIFKLVGQRKQTKATAVVQMFHAKPDRHNWTKFKTGVVCFVKDNIRKSFYIQLFDLTTKSMVYEQELYDQFTYKQDKPYFHSYPGDKFMVGLNFADQSEASRFYEAINTKLEKARKMWKERRSRRQEGSTASKKTPSTDPFLTASRKVRKPRRKIAKADIGMPSDFKPLGHVGFDPTTGEFDPSAIRPEWKKLLEAVGLSVEQMDGRNTANVVDDFVEKHGGIEETNRKLEAARYAPPLPPHGTNEARLGDEGPTPPPREASLFSNSPTGHILSRLELQALDSLLSAYSDESLREIRLTVQRQRGVTAISREEVEWLLRQRGQFSFAEFLEESIEKGVENLKHHEAYEKALQEGRHLMLRYLKFLFFGPPRSGKTSARRRLVKEIVNLSKLGVPSLSTGVAESHDVIVKKLSVESAIVSGSEWLSLSRGSKDGEKSGEEDIGYLAKVYFHQVFKQDTADSSEPVVNQRGDLIGTPVATATNDEPVPDQTNGPDSDRFDTTESTNAVEADTSLIISSDEISVHGASQIAEAEDRTESKQLAGAVLTDSEAIEIRDAFDKLNVILQSDSPNDLKRVLEELELIMINMMDIGGQPSFLEMLPTLTISPALYFLFFRLDQQLRKHYPVRFLSTESEPEITLETSYCIKDVLYQCLASIACFSCHLEQPESSSRSQASSSAFLFGTYKDEVNDQQISQIESELREKLMATQLYQEGILLKSSKGKMFFTLDNMHGTDESEMSDIRKEIEMTIKTYFPAIPIPLSWLMFRIVLQLLNKPVVSLTQCEHIAERLKMSSPIQDALWFFHHDVGSLLHYTSIPSMKDTVICDPQVIFDCINTLIIDKFHYGNRAVRQAEVDEFLQKGIFGLSRIKEKTESQQNSHLTLKQIMDTLQHLNILAEVKDESNPSSSVERKFIMPAVLKYASEEELTQPSLASPDEQQAAPLLIHFDGGFLPFGVFCALMAHLVAHQNSLSPKWQLCGDQVRRNKVTFCVDGALYVTLISQPQFIKIFATRHPRARSKKSLPYLCSSVRQTVIATLETVLTKMKYKPFGATTETPSKQPFSLAFACCVEDSHSDHVMTAVEDETDEGEIEMYAKCIKGELEADLEDEHLIWFTDNSVFQRFQHLDSTIAQSTANKSGGTQRLSIDDLHTVQSKTWDARSKWYEMGLALSIAASTLDAERRNNRDICEDCYTSVLKEWLRNNTRPTWSAIAEALRSPSVGLPHLAKKLPQ